MGGTASNEGKMPMAQTLLAVFKRIREVSPNLFLFCPLEQANLNSAKKAILAPITHLSSTLKISKHLAAVT